MNSPRGEWFMEHLCDGRPSLRELLDAVRRTALPLNCNAKDIVYRSATCTTETDVKRRMATSS